MEEFYRRLTEIELPVEIVNSNLCKLRHDEASHPVGGRGRRSTASSPSQGIDFRVVDPWDLCETGTVEEVIQEEH